MALSYTLHPNKLNEGSNNYRATIKNRRIYSLNRIIEKMGNRHSVFTEAEMEGIILQFFDAVEYILKDGGTVVTPLFTARSSIAGIFTGPDDSFYRNRHQVKINLKPGSRLKGLADKIKTKKVHSSLPKPAVDTFTDMNSGTVNSQLTPGGAAIIKGKRLKYDQDDEQQGIFMVNSKRKEFKVETVYKNTFSQGMMMIPAGLQPGEYRLQVRSNLNTTTIRIGELSQVLLVS
jgi:hypothetical protein